MKCKANPCCADPYRCKVPMPQYKSGLKHLNADYFLKLKDEEFYNNAYDYADSLSDVYGCDEITRKRLTELFLQAINYGNKYKDGIT